MQYLIFFYEQVKESRRVNNLVLNGFPFEYHNRKEFELATIENSLINVKFFATIYSLKNKLCNKSERSKACNPEMN